MIISSSVSLIGLRRAYFFIFYSPLSLPTNFLCEVFSMSMNFHRKLPIPKEVKEEFPLTEKMLKVKEERDNGIKAVFQGKSDKFILIIGPCSADY